METAVNQELQEAQERLLQKRAALNQTENPGQKIDSTKDFFREIADRCMEKCNGPVDRVEYLSDYREEPVKKERPSTGHISEIPKAYSECSFENFTGNERLIEDLKKIAETKDSILLRGNTGCGKTHLAIAMAKIIPTEWHSNNWDLVPGAIFTTAPELLLKIRSSFQKEAKQTEEEIINYYSDCDVLVLDDLGSEKTSEFAVTTFYIILDRRIRDCKQTIITTNLSQKEIEDTFGARIASRLSSMTNIKINMPDYRKKRS